MFCFWLTTRLKSICFGSLRPNPDSLKKPKYFLIPKNSIFPLLPLRNYRLHFFSLRCAIKKICVLDSFGLLNNHFVSCFGNLMVRSCRNALLLPTHFDLQTRTSLRRLAGFLSSNCFFRFSRLFENSLENRKDHNEPEKQKWFVSM